MPPSQIDRLISQVDTDNDGVIRLDELVAAISGEEPEEVDSVETIATKQYSENVVERIIKKYSIEDKADFLSYAASFDENDNDYLTEAELKKAAEAYSDETTTENDTITDEAESTESESVESEENEPEDVGAIEADDVDSEENTDENMDVGDEVSDDDEDKEDQSVEQQHEDVEESETTSDEHLRTLVTAAVDQDMTIRSMFESMDLDENGLIDGPELQKGISSIVGDYLSPGDIMGIISLVDKDSNGRIDAFELIEVIESMEIEIESDVAVKPIDLLTDFMDSMEINPGSFFRKLDKNGDGKINRIELSEALKEQANDDADDETISELISMFDEDGDESIDLIEFISALEEESDEEPDEESSLSVPLYPKNSPQSGKSE